MDKTLNRLYIKEIETKAIPFSNEVDTRIFSRILDADRVVASYKMYWLLGVLNEVSLGNEEIEFRKIISRMIVSAWYPILKFKLHFGAFDNLSKCVEYISINYQIDANCDENKLLDFIYENKDKELNKKLKEFENNVPYRLLSPFFQDELRGKKDSIKEKIITEMSLKSSNCLYKIIKGDTNKIFVNCKWCQYLKYNYNIIKSWIYYKLVCFLQKRNPNVPAIVFKLEAPKTRKLTSTSKLWKEILNYNRVKDIYTGFEFTKENFIRYGALSIDHFIPWSFVLHDEIWNLVPTFKNINSKKSDNLVLFDKYIGDFCAAQYNAYTYVCDKRKKNQMEEYMNILHLDSPKLYYNRVPQHDFEQKIKLSISPLYQIAVNQGFGIMNKF
ncbi:HNH endonuclease domain-containing protein [Haloimpatiens sp. FM7315]|uniref:HNH endonuclease domain-containing protein n=1 Tax=Haloimpatiens sp. FM7315 TaxID=3298609 RepID=UPI0035A29D1C